MHGRTGRLFSLMGLIAVIAAAVALAACGNSEDVTITQTRRTETTEEMPTTEVADGHDDGDRESRRTSTHRRSTPSARRRGATARRRRRVRQAESCGDGVFVEGSTTSCAFGPQRRRRLLLVARQHLRKLQSDYRSVLRDDLHRTAADRLHRRQQRDRLSDARVGPPERARGRSGCDTDGHGAADGKPNPGRHLRARPHPRARRAARGGEGGRPAPLLPPDRVGGRARDGDRGPGDGDARLQQLPRA